MLTPLTVKCVTDNTGRQAHIASALLRGLPTLTAEKEKSGPLAVCGSGPSLVRSVDVLRNWPGEIWAINGALDFLVSEGIEPAAFVTLDPLTAIVGYLKSPPKNTKYYLASVCHPDVFDALSDREVHVWHAAQYDMKLPSGVYAVGGGPFSLTRAPMLGHLQGWRDVHVFGGDSSWDKEFYADGGPAPVFKSDEQWNADKPIHVSVDGKRYQTSPIFLHQASFFCMLKDVFDGKLTFHDDGLTNAIVNQQVTKLESFNEEAAA